MKLPLHMLAAFAIVAAPIGCDDAPTPAASSVSPTAATPPSPEPVPSVSASGAAAPTPQSQAPLGTEPARILYRNEKREVGSALVYREGGSALKVAVSTHRRFCDNIRGNRITTTSGELFFRFVIANELDTAGQPIQYISETSLGTQHESHARQRPGGQLQVLEGDAKLGGKMRLLVRAGAKGAVLDGAITATGCGDIFQPQRPVNEPAGLTVTVGDRPHTIRSARAFQLRGSTAIVLSTAPAGCGDEGPWGDLSLTVHHTSGASAKSISLAGDMYPTSQVADSSPVNVEVERDEVTSDYRFALKGNATAAGYPLALNVRGTATFCP